jgi:NADH-quinone oxidoreductase subunit C
MYYFTLYKLLYKYIYKIIVYPNSQYFINIEVNELYNVMYFLKNSLLFKIQALVDICAIDWIYRIHRFTLYYNIYSYIYNIRLFIVIDIPVFFSFIYGLGIESLSKLYNSSPWLEREIWDMFGIFFYNHTDLRRILTDYGFLGFPFRKDFPLTGYKEIRYDDVNKIIINENLKLMQEFRVFNFINPWI